MKLHIGFTENIPMNLPYIIIGFFAYRIFWSVGRPHPLKTALHTISISLQNSFCESHTWRLVSWKTLRALNAHWALPVYPVFEDKKSNVSDENRSSEKLHRKNIAGGLPEISRNNFIDLQSQKNSKKDRPKNSSFHWRLICYMLLKNL